MAGAIIDVTDATFEVEVLESEKPVIVDFWAPWCGPCRVVSPILEEINAEREDLRVVKVNVDENQATAVRYEILSIPTMILFKNGEIAKKVIGAPCPRRGWSRSSSRRSPEPWSLGRSGQSGILRGMPDSRRVPVAYKAVALAGGAAGARACCSASWPRSCSRC